jgi:hypothetical protein
VILIPGATKLPVCPISGLDQPGIFVDAANILQNLEENVDTGKIKFSSGGVQAVGEVADKANAQGLVTPRVT